MASKLWRALALALAMAMLAAACGGSGDSASNGGGSGDGGGGAGTSNGNGGGGGSSEGTAEDQTDATLIIGIASDVGSLDPQSISGTGGGNWPTYEPVFGGLLGGGSLASIDPETLEYLPGVADSWEVSDDSLEWTFQLNPNVKFHNGEPVTAEDVKFSMDRQIGQAEYNPDYQAGYGAQFAPIVDRVEVIDDHTVTFYLNQADVIFLRRPLYIVPKAYIEEVGDDGFANHPIGIGPFKFVSRIPDSEIVLERFDDYHLGFDHPSGVHPAYIETVIQRIIPDDSARLAALQAGEIDMAHNVSSDIARQLESEGQYQVFYLPGTQPMAIDINTELETDEAGGPNPWRDKRVREAANLAVDLDTIIATILTGQERPTFGSSSTGFGFPADLPEQRFGYDPDRARELLADAGYPDGFSTTMTGPTGRWPNTRPVMEAVAQYLSEVGITVSIQELQYQEVVTRIQERNLPGLVFFGCSSGIDPGANFRYCYYSGGNFSFGTPVDITPEGDITDRIDELILASESETDDAARRELLEEIISEFYLSAKRIWLYEPVTVLVSTNEWSWELLYADRSNPDYWAIRPID